MEKSFRDSSCHNYSSMPVSLTEKSIIIIRLSYFSKQHIYLLSGLPVIGKIPFIVKWAVDNLDVLYTLKQKQAKSSRMKSCKQARNILHVLTIMME